ncbi:MAG: prepilin-type N-terminal cleavage/methylation domain-containing protein [Luteimonas sp.]|nr:prepilin-type N-terminal cleavage/methylation domain-containing protein [Luteimonas sp.]
MTNHSPKQIPLDRRGRGRMVSRSRMCGISLIEVMVSVLVLGVGLLGIAAMQSVALRGGQSSLESTQAVMQTTAIIEAMRANWRSAADYNTAMMCDAKTGTSLAVNDLNHWVDSLQDTIGSGACGQISDCPGDCVITVRWDDSRAGGGATRTIVTRASI